MNHEKPSKLMPVLVGGCALGVASAIPVLNFLNCACCALVIGGGILATYLYQQGLPPGVPLTYGDGALLGVLAGLVGAVAGTLVSIPLRLLTGEIGASFVNDALEELRSDPNIPPEVLSLMEQLASPEGVGAAVILFSLLTSAIIYVVFAAIGGCLGVALFQRTPPPPAGVGTATPPGQPGPGTYTPPTPPPPTGGGA